MSTPAGPSILAAHPWWQRPFRLVRAVLAKVYIEPVVEGRLRVVGWPRGLPLLAMIATVGYVLAMVLAVASPWLRSWMDLQLLRGGIAAQGIPSGLPWMVVSLLTVAAILLQAGALHSPWWLRIGMLLVSFSLMTTAGSLPSTLTQLAIMVGSFLALVIFQIVRWRREFRWWEFAVVALCFVGPLLIGAETLSRTRAVGGVGPVDWTMLTMPQVGLLAAPVALLAGYAIAQWAFATVVWSVDIGRRELPRWVLMLVLIVLLVWRLIAELSTLDRKILTPVELIAPGLLLVGVVVAWVVLDKIADRRGPASTRLADLSEDLRSVALPFAVLITLPGVVSTAISLPLQVIGTIVGTNAPGQLTDVLSTWLGGRTFSIIAAVALLAWSVVLARRADRGRAELVAVMALSFLGLRLFSATGSTDLLGLWVIIPLTLIFLALVITRRLTRNRLESMLVAAGLTAVLSARQFFADPVNALLGGSAALVISLVWQFLTSGTDGNDDTPRWPRPTRVLLLLGNALLGMAVLAYNRMSLDTIGVLEVSQLIGDRALGGSLILGSIVAVVLAVFRQEDLSGQPVPLGQGQGSVPVDVRGPAPAGTAPGRDPKASVGGGH